MTDHISPEHRSCNTSRIKSKDTKIEVKVRSWLFARGFRFRKSDKRYPGKPDIVLPKIRPLYLLMVAFGTGMKVVNMPQCRRQGWITGMQSLRFERNVANDKLHGKQLEELGWKVITLWECELKKDAFIERMSSLEAEIRKRQ